LSRKFNNSAGSVVGQRKIPFDSFGRTIS
jgi:hypothetical protein